MASTAERNERRPSKAGSSPPERERALDPGIQKGLTGQLVSAREGSWKAALSLIFERSVPVCWMLLILDILLDVEPPNVT